MITVKSIQRYPMKGLSPERLREAAIGKGGTLPADRAFAIENGPSGFDAAAPGWLPKAKFLCGMKNPKLSLLEARYDDPSGMLTVSTPDASVTGDLKKAEGRAAIEAFLSVFMGDEQRGPLRILSAEGHSFSDVSKKVVSFINLASVAEIGQALGAELDPVRFRGNVHIAGMPAWTEATLVGKEFQIGEARFRAVKTIQRCLATHVDPARGVRDHDVMGTIRNMRGDMDCGIYAEAVSPGTIRTGDEILLMEPEIPL